MFCLAQTDIWLQSAYQGSDQILISQVMSIVQRFSALSYGSLPQLCSWLQEEVWACTIPGTAGKEPHGAPEGLSASWTVGQHCAPGSSAYPAPLFGLRLSSGIKLCWTRLCTVPLSSQPHREWTCISLPCCISWVASLAQEKSDAVGLCAHTGKDQSHR